MLNFLIIFITLRKTLLLILLILFHDSIRQKTFIMDFALILDSDCLQNLTDGDFLFRLPKHFLYSVCRSFSDTGRESLGLFLPKPSTGCGISILSFDALHSVCLLRAHSFSWHPIQCFTKYFFFGGLKVLVYNVHTGSTHFNVHVLNK